MATVNFGHKKTQPKLGRCVGYLSVVMHWLKDLYKNHLKVGFIIRFLVLFFQKPFLFLFRILLLSRSSLRHQEAYRYADAKP